jgi:Subtilase family
MWRVTLALVLYLAATGAQAQLGRTGVRLPLQLPQVSSLGGTLNNVDPLPAAQALQAVRRLQVRDLLRRNRATLEADPAGAAILRSEILALSPSDADLALAQTAGFSVIGVRALDGLDGQIVSLRAPVGMTTAQALVRLRAQLPAGRFDFNHVYGESGTASDAVAGSAATPATASAASAASELRLGLIDGGVDDSHPVFRGSRIHHHGCGEALVPSAHGTAVASLMVGRSGDFHGGASGAELYAADVYCGTPTGGAVDAVAESMAWLVHERVPVINVSLVGPPNLILESVVNQVISKGFVIVAAVGNDGPAAAPLYPASYPGVVGVTAVDAHRHVLVEAARGPQVRFAAPGADMVAATSPAGFAAVRGTSFAAPLVASLLAGQLPQPDVAASAHAISELGSRALDLGTRGPDPVYGYGLVGDDLRPDIRLAGWHAR